MSIPSSHSHASVCAELSVHSQGSAGDVFVCPVSIRPTDACASWPLVLHQAGWRAFAKRSVAGPCPHTEWLLKNKHYYLAFQQLDTVECAQQLRLPRERATEVLRLFGAAGLLAN